MFRNNIFMALVFGSFFACFTTANAEVIFSDSFESGDMSTTNSDGFRWGGNNRTSVVTRDAACSSPGTDVAIWNNGEICSEKIPSVRDYTAKTGKNSLRFMYLANTAWAEQRFEMNAGHKHIYIGYWIRVPINFSRGNANGGTSNNKWMWVGQGKKTDVYSKSDSLNFWVRDLQGSENSITVDIQYMYPPSGTYRTSPGYSNFITPADAGRWMHIVYDLKFSSVNGKADGNLVMYRKWQGEANYTKIIAFENTDIPVGAVGYDGWGGGYILGYANGTYVQDTEWLLDDFTVSTTSLFGNPPKSPGQVTGIVK